MNTKNRTNLIVIGKYERLKKKNSGTLCLPERLIVYISTT